jgi:hypothetical protein
MIILIPSGPGGPDLPTWAKIALFAVIVSLLGFSLYLLFREIVHFG